MAETPLFAENKIKELTDLIFPGKEAVSSERLGGLTNFSFKVVLDNGEKYVYRLPGDGTEEVINRKDEKASTLLACELGIDTEMLMFDENTGIKVMKFIEGDTMSPETMRGEKNVLDAADIFKKLHASGKDTGVRFEVFEMAESYEKFIIDNGVSLFSDYETIRKEVMKIKEEVDKLGILRVPCHNDSLCENWMRDEKRLYLVDWEYAGMNDPYWDLADISVEASYNRELEEKLLERYLEKTPDDKDWLRFSANKVYIDFLWSLWGKIRVPFDGQPMEEYAQERYDRMKENMKLIPGFEGRNGK